jgi:hypothetical protein
MLLPEVPVIRNERQSAEDSPGRQSPAAAAEPSVLRCRARSPGTSEYIQLRPLKFAQARSQPGAPDKTRNDHCQIPPWRMFVSGGKSASHREPSQITQRPDNHPVQESAPQSSPEMSGAVALRHGFPSLPDPRGGSGNEGAWIRADRTCLRMTGSNACLRRQRGAALTADGALRIFNDIPRRLYFCGDRE